MFTPADIMTLRALDQKDAFNLVQKVALLPPQDFAEMRLVGVLKDIVGPLNKHAIVGERDLGAFMMHLRFLGESNGICIDVSAEYDYQSINYHLRCLEKHGYDSAKTYKSKWMYNFYIREYYKDALDLRSQKKAFTDVPRSEWEEYVEAFVFLRISQIPAAPKVEPPPAPTPTAQERFSIAKTISKLLGR